MLHFKRGYEGLFRIMNNSSFKLSQKKYVIQKKDTTSWSHSLLSRSPNHPQQLQHNRPGTAVSIGTSWLLSCILPLLPKRGKQIPALYSIGFIFVPTLQKLKITSILCSHFRKKTQTSDTLISFSITYLSFLSPH